MKIQLENNFICSRKSTPYIIAEIGANHNGDLDLAKKLIKSAKDNGAHCAKFQSWSKSSLFSKAMYDSNSEFENDIDKYATSFDELRKLKEFCEEYNITFSSTPFSYEEADFLIDELKIPFVKIASMDVNNYPFLKHIAEKQIPIILSTGLSELYEIDKAIHTIESAGNKNIIILHCVAEYPPEINKINLNKFDSFLKLYPYPIGFSDHTLGTAIPLAAVAKGAILIEKHYTLDKSTEGWDHAISLDPEELNYLSKESKNISLALGSSRITSSESQEKKNIFRRSLIAANNINKGQIITPSDITEKRPGTGISPDFKEFIIGKIAQKDIKEDSVITKDCF